MVLVSLTTQKQNQLLLPDMGSAGFLIAAVAAALVTITSTTPLKFEPNFPTGGSNEIYRLPTTVVPYHYDIGLLPLYPDGSSNFTGTVSINVTVVSITNVIIVHAQNLAIDVNATSVYSFVENASVPISTQTYDQLRHFYILTFTGNLPVGNYSLYFEFVGQHTDEMTGFYRSSYREGNETRWLVTTQFQPTSARRAFPCFDEPGLKATFNVSLWRLPNQIALSNMPAISTGTPDPSIGNRTRVQFAQTPLMSTYILAFIVSDFTNSTSTEEFFSIWSRPEVISDGTWALESTQALYRIFLNVLVTDPWPKIDQIAIPDFSAGAMENWGLITYRERLLLWREGESSLRNREAITTTISHELAHIWFGNLVSPKWWDHLWFNEGFASFFELRIPSLTNPQWRLAERSVTDNQLAAMITDSLESTRAMNNPVGSPSSVTASFDTIAYSKSAAVLRMLNRIMREDLFERALRQYLTQHAFGTFEPEDLWAEMQSVADASSAVQNNVPLSAIMNSWTNQPGFPLVTAWRNYSTNIVAFSQERFFLNPNSPTADPEAQRWWIPITFALGTNPTRCNSAFIQPDWLRAQDKAIMVNGFVNTTWVLANCQGIGFYRTNYDTRNWGMLTEFLKSYSFIQINPTNRAILIDDSLNLARAGYIDYSIPLNLIGYLSQEWDFVVWRSAIRSLTYLNTILVSNENFVHWQAYLASLVSHVSQDLGWVPDSADDHTERIFRGQIQTLACELNIGNSRNTAESQFNLWIINPQLNAIDADLKATVYCWGIKNASEATWDIVWNRFLTTNLASEESVLLSSLACSQNATILNKYLQFSITPNSGIRSHDTYSVFSSILANGDDNIDMLLDFIVNNTAAITQFYGSMNAVSNMLAGISGRITRRDQLDKLRTVTETQELDVSAAAIERAIQSASENLEWISRNEPAIEAWLREEGFIPETSSSAQTTAGTTASPATNATTIEIPTTTQVTSTTETTGGSTVFIPSSFFILAPLAVVTSNYFLA